MLPPTITNRPTFWDGPATSNPARIARLAADAFRMFVAGRLWKLKILLVILALALTRTFPSYDAVQTDFVKATWRSAQVKFDHPFTDMAKAFPPGSHEGKLTFRMTVPLLAYAFQLTPRGVLIVNAAFGLMILFLVLGLVERITDDRALACLIGLTTACTWPGQTAFHEFRGGYYDAAALCALLLAMSARAPWAAGLWAIAAAWTDERALLALPLVLMVESTRPRRVAIVAAGAVYLLLRLGLASLVATPTAGVGISVLLSQIATVPLGFWTGLGGNWILVLASLFVLFQKRNWFTAIPFILALVTVLAASAVVVDLTRSAAYCLPAVFVAMQFAQGSARLRTVAAIGACLTFLTPSAYVEGQAVYWLHSWLALS